MVLNYRNGLLFCLASALLIALAEAKAPSSALQSAYPDPRKKPAACGRKGVSNSHVCDPHGVLSQAAADRVDMVARSASRFGPDPSVVLMKSILLEKPEAKLRFSCKPKAKKAAEELLESWKAEELILVSSDDFQFCIVQKGKVLSERDITEAQEQAAELLSAQDHTKVELLDHAISHAIMQMQQKATEDAPAGVDGVVVVPPTAKEMRQTIWAHTIPFIGFGITDNGLMIICGEVIEQFLGARLGLSTMGAAATGNLLSDIAGIFLGGQVQALSHRLGASEPDFTKEQRQLPVTRYCKMAGEALGITIGCWIGMAPLLFVDHADDMDLPQETLKTLPHVKSYEGFSA
eukprot:CAMPEP_0181299836 /NCGR_PEP_ID=MMETSP1101-20121128/6565_1 /TAXON_ID=46948 /ORGANISM="Rhodomonas abbreviata, Strain Caron Lab Isolate" /LENGTH=347 /DNA_ID=CAMNT_0023405025 /DNA_START=170 /DNA_END=1213 /DNA_ORIENTATION=-